MTGYEYRWAYCTAAANCDGDDPGKLAIQVGSRLRQLKTV